jgi:sugar/nucleoside kinase (ribokinase family)
MGKRYNVYGIGNALVDMEFEVAPETLQNLGIDKGVMTLVDESRQTELIEKLGVSHKRSGGGSAANTMVAIAQLGGKGFYSCKVGNDEAGKFYLNDLRSCGLDTNEHGGQAEVGVTGKCLVLVTPDADRTMNTFLGITGEISERELAPEAIANADYLYLEGYLVTSPTAKAAAIKGREIAASAGVKTALSLSDPNMAIFFREGLWEMIGTGLDFVFANESEALTLSATEEIEEAIEHFKRFAKGFAITRGAKGSLIYDGQTLREIAPHPVTAIDTVGAGDMYAGAFLYGITHGMDYAKAGDLASLAAARVVSRFGARLDIEEIRSLRDSRLMG